MKRLALVIALASVSGVQGCASLTAEQHEPADTPTAQEQSMAMQGKELHLEHQVQRPVAVRWGNWGRGGAAMLQPAYVHVLLGEDDPQGAHDVTYPRAVELREDMYRRQAKMAGLQAEMEEARRIRSQLEAEAVKEMMGQLKVDEGVVGLEPSVYATQQPAAEVIARLGEQNGSKVRAAVEEALDESDKIVIEHFGQSEEDMLREHGSISELLMHDRWRMACAGYDDLLDEGDYAMLMQAGGPEALPDDATPNNCPGLFPTEPMIEDLTNELCPSSGNFSAKRIFYSELFAMRGIESQFYNPETDMLEQCLAK